MHNDKLSYAIQNRRSVRQYLDKSVHLEDLNKLIWAAQGITEQSGKRAVPSAHALYPLQLVVTSGNVDGLEQGLHTVSSETGKLELLSSEDVRAALHAAAVDDQPWVSNAPMLITICANYVESCRAFADQKPYGRRGPSYVAIEAGAAAQNIMLQATSLGLGSVLVAGVDDDATTSVLKLPVPLSPVLHICIGWPA